MRIAIDKKRTISSLKIFYAPVLASPISMHYFILVTSYLHSVITIWYDVSLLSYSFQVTIFFMWWNHKKWCKCTVYSLSPVVFRTISSTRFLRQLSFLINCIHCSRRFKIPKLAYRGNESIKCTVWNVRRNLH